MNIYRSTPKTLLVGIAVWLASFTLFYLTVAPTLTWGANQLGVDGGELLAAADTFGVPHPPGYPTYTLLLKLFATVVPVGDFAYRGNLFSSVMASTAAVLIYVIVLQLSARWNPLASRLLRVVSSVLAALVFSTSPLLWSQATITEVYSLNAVFAGLLLLITISTVNHDSSERDKASLHRRLSLVGFLLGIGLGNHLTLLIVALPVLAWMVASLGWRRTVSPWLISSFLIGLSIYIYLPVSAAQNPPVNWGNADTMQGIFWMITGSAYQEYFGVPAVTLPGRLLEWTQLLFVQFNPLGIFLAIVGARWLFFRNRRLFFVSVCTAAMLTTYSIMFNSVDSEVLMIPVILYFSIWIGAGFLHLVSNAIAWSAEINRPYALPRVPKVRFAASHVAVALSAIAFGSLPVTSVALNYDSLDLSDNKDAYGYASEIIETVPDGSIVFSTLEGRVFSLWYMRFVEETASDVLPVAVPLLQFDWYWENMHENFPHRVPSKMPPDYTEAVKRIVEHSEGDARVFFTYKDAFVQDSFELDPFGNLFEARLKDQLVTEEAQSMLLQPGR